MREDVAHFKYAVLKCFVFELAEMTVKSGITPTYIMIDIFIPRGSA
jgi:hypothetical protein